MNHRLRMTIGVLAFIGMTILVTQQIRPMTCHELDVALTAYDWYMKTNVLDYDEWVEYVEMSFQWDNKGCGNEREASKGAEESPSTGHNSRSTSFWKWPVHEGRQDVLPAKEGAGKEHLQEPETVRS